jgi:prevent-host-death family protein
MIEEMEAGRIVNKKTREPIGERTIDFYSKAIDYLNDVAGDKLLATLENAEARDLVARMKLETLSDGTKRFGNSGKTIVEYFKTFQKVIASATDDRGNQLHPRNWNLAFIGLPKVNKRKQHCPTLMADEITHIVANAKGKYRVAAALLAGSNIRISELLALRIEKHISDDRSTLFIRRVEDERRSLVIEKRGTPRAVLLSIRDYVRLAAPEPEVLRILGEESEANGTDKLRSQQIDKIIRETRAKQTKRR